MSRKILIAALIGASLATAGMAYAADTSTPAAAASSAKPAAKPAKPAAKPATPAKPSLYSRAQTKLKDLGDYDGPVNGQRTKATVAAIEKFQKAQSLKVSGRLTPETVKALGV